MTPPPTTTTPDLATPSSPDERTTLRNACTSFLCGAGPTTAATYLAAMAASPHSALGLDHYSNGPAITLLETRIATLLGKEAGLWFPKGIVAQQAALLVHAEQRNHRAVVLHPQSHLAVDEKDAIARLAHLLPVRLGPDERHFTVADLDTVREPLAAITLELPLRRPGYQALPWDDLQAIATWARTAGIPLHLDGARLWEVQPWYDRPLADLAGLADTIYVSLYKGLGGLGGCILAGTRATIEAAKPWRLRYGGDLPVAFPMVITALDALDTTLPRMTAYHHRAIEIATALRDIQGITAFPDPPHCNSFQLHFTAGPAQLNQAVLELARTRHCWLFHWFNQGLLPNTAMTELFVGDATLKWTINDITAALIALRDTAQSLP
jgi:threonine aldolase